MAVNQIYEILNSINEQANTGAQLTAIDTRSFISYGESLESLAANGKETWFKTLVDRIASTIIDNRSYTAKTAAGLWKEPFEYGAALVKLHAKMPEVSADPAFFDPEDLANTNPFAPTIREVEQRIYNKISAFCIDDTIPDVQLKTAFLSEQRMQAFLDGLMMTTENSFKRSVENLGNTCRAALAVTAINEEGAHYVKLLTEYKATLADDDPGQALDADGALYDRDFLRFASRRIAMVVDQMQYMTSIFAAEGYERWTPREYMNVAILNDFQKSVDSYLASATYWKDLVTLPEENRIILPYWQAFEGSASFETNSSIDMILPGSGETAETGIEVEAQYVVAMIYDSEAAGITIDERRTSALYNPKDEFTNYWHKGRQQYYIDATQPHVVFAIV